MCPITNIIFVDDEMPVVNLLSSVFRRMSNLTGVHLCSCCKYNAAIEELNACDPQSTVCLLDQELSSLEGDGDCLAEICELKGIRYARMTGSALELKHQGIRVLSKPCTISEIQGILRELIGK